MERQTALIRAVFCFTAFGHKYNLGITGVLSSKEPERDKKREICPFVELRVQVIHLAAPIGMKGS